MHEINSDDADETLGVGVGTPRPTDIYVIVEKNGWPEYLIENAKVALQALDIMGIEYDVNDLKSLELFGRFYALTENIRIDVGHNPLAAQAIVKALDKKVVLIYNSLDDKEYEEVLRILKPKIKWVEIIKIDSQRATTLDDIEKAVENVGLEYSYFQNEIDEDESYLVFGSFYVVEEFLKSFPSTSSGNESNRWLSLPKSKRVDVPK